MIDTPEKPNKMDYKPQPSIPSELEASDVTLVGSGRKDVGAPTKDQTGIQGSRPRPELTEPFAPLDTNAQMVIHQFGERKWGWKEKDRREGDRREGDRRTFFSRLTSDNERMAGGFKVFQEAFSPGIAAQRMEERIKMIGDFLSGDPERVLGAVIALRESYEELNTIVTGKPLTPQEQAKLDKTLVSAALGFYIPPSGPDTKEKGTEREYWTESEIETFTRLAGDAGLLEPPSGEAPPASTPQTVNPK